MFRHIAALLALVHCPPAVGMKLRTQAFANFTNRQVSSGLSFKGLKWNTWQDCNEQHPHDLFRPVRQVLKEHPGVDGNCWFHFAADYLGDSRDYAETFKYTVKQFSNRADEGPAVTWHLDSGEEIHSHEDNVFGNFGNYGIDDSMCYQMGWMKGQRLDQHIMKLQDREAWLKVTEEECARLPAMAPELTDENQIEMSIGFMAKDNGRICDASTCLRLPRGDTSCGPQATKKDYVEHLYPKCLLGGDRLVGAAVQIAWCFARACVTEGNNIKHGKNCWPNGLPF